MQIKLPTSDYEAAIVFLTECECIHTQDYYIVTPGIEHFYIVFLTEECFNEFNNNFKKS